MDLMSPKFDGGTATLQKSKIQNGDLLKIILSVYTKEELLQLWTEVRAFSMEPNKITYFIHNDQRISYLTARFWWS